MATGQLPDIQSCSSGSRGEEVQKPITDSHSSVSTSSASSSSKPVVTIISTRTGRRTSIHHDTEFADHMNAYIVSPLIPLPKPPPRTQRCQRRSRSRRNPTLDRLLQPPGSQCDLSPTQQLLEKLRSLKLQLQRHASHSRWPPRDLILMETIEKQRQKETQLLNSGPLLLNNDDDSSDGIVCTDSDIRAIVADLLQQESRHRQQLIGVVPMPDSPSKRLVCFIDPRRNRLAPPDESHQPQPSESSEPAKLQLCDSCRRPLQPAGDESRRQPKEVLFDENGQTWEIYGADLDPDLLGRAIQTHLAAIKEQTATEQRKN